MDSDSQVAIKLVSQGCCTQHQFSNLIKQIHAVHNYQGHVTWSHILREVNQVAETLAKQALMALNSKSLRFLLNVFTS